MRPDLRTYLVNDEWHRVFGPGPADLLERVGRLGSLRAAAIDMGMAYTKATRIVRDAERAFGFAVTERTVGGSGGGGSRLTPAALDLLERYRAFERASERALERSYAACFAGFGDVARLGCVVMASGEGRRFGGAPGEKLTAPLAGVPVLERTLSALPADLLDVVVVTRWRAVEELCDRLGVRCVVHESPLKSDSVRAGLDAVGPRAGVLFVPGDQPLLAPGSVRALVSSFWDAPEAVHRLAWHGRPGSPVLWPAVTLGALSRLEGDEGGSALLAARSAVEGGVVLVEAADGRELADVDEPGDLEALAGALGEEGGPA